MREGVAELAAFVDRARRLRRYVRRDAAGERELPEQATQAVHVVADRRVDLAVRAFQIRVGDSGRSAVTRAHHVDRVEPPTADDAVEMDVDEVQPGRRAPVPEQARLDMLG